LRRALFCPKRGMPPHDKLGALSRMALS
jgi:hypothetical protein